MTEKEAFNRLIRIMGTFDLATGHADTWTDLLDNLEEELRDMRGYLVKRIKELEGEREKLFNAHSVEMTRADVLNQRIEELEKDLHMVERHYDSLTTERTQYRELSDEELNKAFDYYCETDEGVLRFNYELRDEWKKEQLIRWKEAFKKASEK